MKYTDLHRAQWLKNPSWETDGVYENVAVIFRIWSQSQHFKVIFMSQNDFLQFAFSERRAQLHGPVRRRCFNDWRRRNEDRQGCHRRKKKEEKGRPSEYFFMIFTNYFFKSIYPIRAIIFQTSKREMAGIMPYVNNVVLRLRIVNIPRQGFSQILIAYLPVYQLSIEKCDLRTSSSISFRSG